MYQSFTTNSGLCFSFETKNDIVFITSDIKVMHEHVFQGGEGGSEIYVGRLVNLDGVIHKITNMSSNSDLQLTPSYPDIMTGHQYKYSHVLRLLVKPVR